MLCTCQLRLVLRRPASFLVLCLWLSDCCHEKRSHRFDSWSRCRHRDRKRNDGTFLQGSCADCKMIALGTSPFRRFPEGSKFLSLYSFVPAWSSGATTLHGRDRMDTCSSPRSGEKRPLYDSSASPWETRIPAGFLRCWSGALIGPYGNTRGISNSRGIDFFIRAVRIKRQNIGAAFFAVPGGAERMSLIPTVSPTRDKRPGKHIKSSVRARGDRQQKAFTVRSKQNVASPVMSRRNAFDITLGAHEELLDAMGSPPEQLVFQRT